MIGMWFSFGGDSECLRESVLQFRETFPDGVVAICDDAKNPISDSVRNAMNPNYYEHRKWDSKSNLNGWECVRGMLEYQIEMHRKFPSHHGALKIDCDTLILGDDWILEHSPICGLDIGTQVFFTGCARYLRRDVPAKLLDFIAKKYTRDIAVPEDQVIANLCMALYGAECERIDWHVAAMSYSYLDESYNERKSQVITFGNRHEIKHGTPCDKRAFAGMAMANFRLKKQHERTV
jgi:hypothetical protein